MDGAESPSSGVLEQRGVERHCPLLEPASGRVVELVSAADGRLRRTSPHVERGNGEAGFETA